VTLLVEIAACLALSRDPGGPCSRPAATLALLSFSGKERGHGTELAYCPKCNKALKPGKHHVGCSAVRPSAPRQVKRKVRPTVAMACNGLGAVRHGCLVNNTWRCMRSWVCTCREKAPMARPTKGAPAAWIIRLGPRTVCRASHGRTRAKLWRRFTLVLLA
jgi:hypothetical protein